MVLIYYYIVIGMYVGARDLLSVYNYKGLRECSPLRGGMLVAASNISIPENRKPVSDVKRLNELCKVVGAI